MHHSDDPEKRVFAASCYLDDSGSEEDAPIVVMGGIVLDKESYTLFDKQWVNLLHVARIDKLHMVDFVRPYGKHIGMQRELKIALFTKAARIIRRFRDYSVTSSVDNLKYKAGVPLGMYRGVIGSYAVAFTGVLELNSKLSEINGYPDQMAYLIDETRTWADQLKSAHMVFRAWEKKRDRHMRTVGTLTFGDDSEITALQAADVIAWSKRRHLLGKLDDEFAPLNELFTERFDARGHAVNPHYHYSTPDDHADRLLKQLETNGAQLKDESRNAIAALLDEARPKD